MIIKSKIKDYEVVFDKREKFVCELSRTKNKVVVIDKNIYRLYRSLFSDNFNKNEIIIVEAVEENKNIEKALEICENIAKLDSKKNTVLISFGGGIIQDLTGFAANVMYRGIEWIFVPTTLLAQADSCIGGKTSINFSGYKNMLGTFFPPDRIYIDLDFIETLKEDDYRSGLGEVVKFNILAGKRGLKQIKEKLEYLLERKTLVLGSFVKRSLGFKKKYIEEDEFDRGIRKHLNFAHTFGHAFEKSSDYKIPHGQAVLLGIMMANFISFERGMLSEARKNEIEKICKKVFSIEFDRTWLDKDVLINAIRRDKKRIGEGLAAVLFYEDFSISVIEDLKKEEIYHAIDYIEGIFQGGIK